MSHSLQDSLSETEVEQLAARLAAYPGALSLEAVDGLFCALLAGPGLIRPSDFLHAILPNESAESGGAFRDLGDAQETVALLMRYWNSIARDFDTRRCTWLTSRSPARKGFRAGRGREATCVARACRRKAGAGYSRTRAKVCSSSSQWSPEMSIRPDRRNH